MQQSVFKIRENKQIATDVYKMVLYGDTSDIIAAGQFINIKLDGFYLRRPISVYDYTDDTVTIIYKIVGKGTKQLSLMSDGELDILTGLGNGYTISHNTKKALLLGGGVGVPPLYNLAKKLIDDGKEVTAVLGFNSQSDVFCEDDFSELGVKTYVTTADGSYGIKGFVTDALDGIAYDEFYTCGPEPMLKAVYNATNTTGQFSFEERMGCGFGACMGCSCKTKYGSKRICKDGPVLTKEEIIW